MGPIQAPFKSLLGRGNKNNGNSKYLNNLSPRTRRMLPYAMLGFVAMWLVILMRSHQRIIKDDLQPRVNPPPLSPHTIPSLHHGSGSIRKTTEIKAQPSNTNNDNNNNNFKKSPVWEEVHNRAKGNQQHCTELDFNFKGFDARTTEIFGEEKLELATLPAFGIVDALETYNFEDASVNAKWQCELPPEHECEEHQMTAIFMAYNPDRLGKTLDEIKKMMRPDIYHNLIKECVIVWNGPRCIEESPAGVELLAYAEAHGDQLRVTYPLKMGFPNDLMNRYHPDVVQVTTKAILYYDDDGPFYKYPAVQGGFELWKRNARAQIGAMARQINYGERQAAERTKLYGTEPTDRQFISQCDNLEDKVAYNFYHFANYDANMVLPSGSMLHSNYLCFLWHPALAPIRDFVLKHPVHPDDITVSTIVSQLGGRAPKVYSRRLNPPDGGTATNKKRRLSEAGDNQNDCDTTTVENEKDGSKPKGAGIGGICWDCGSGMTDKKQVWADLRSQAINSLMRYFGSINSGSIGWCGQETEFYNPKKDGKCDPVMAKQGQLAWMNSDGTPKDTCP